jgi:lysophospholipase L1-like esterase
MRHFLRALLINIGLLSFSLLSVTALAELSVRRWFPQETTVPWLDDIDGVVCPRPNVHGRSAIPDVFDVRLTINSQRFRGTKTYTLVPPANVLRIAMLGDSFTHGVGANDDESYPARLEQYLASRLTDRGATGVEVINAGANSTGTADQALFYHLWVSRFRPQLVVLNVFTNDVDEDMSRQYFTVGPDNEAAPKDFATIRRQNSRSRRAREIARSLVGYSFLAQRLQLVGFVRNRLSSALAPEWSSDPLRDPSTPPSQLDELTHFRRVGLPLLKAELLWLHRRVQADGAGLAVVYLPPRDVIYPDLLSPDSANYRLKSGEIGRALLQVTRQASIPYLDLTNVVSQRATLTQERLYYTVGDFHPTPLGYQTFAELVADFLAAHVTPGLHVNRCGIAAASFLAG